MSLPKKIHRCYRKTPYDLIKCSFRAGLITHFEYVQVNVTFDDFVNKILMLSSNFPDGYFDIRIYREPGVLSRSITVRKTEFMLSNDERNLFSECVCEK